MTEHEIESKISQLQSEGKWQEIINLVQNEEKFEGERLLWVWPTIDDLNWIKSVIEKRKLRGIFSIGCGTGLLEWIIEKHSGCNIIGVEADQNWWRCKYSPPTYLDKIIFIDEKSQHLEVPSDFAVLFCYFNNGPAFYEYMKNYTGNFVFIIGPDEGQNRCTDPLPFDKKLTELKWRLNDSRKLDNNKDYMTIYTKINEEL